MFFKKNQTRHVMNINGTKGQVAHKNKVIIKKKMKL